MQPPAVAPSMSSVPAAAHAPLRAEDGATLARIDLLRGRLAQARSDAVAALLFLSDARQDCDALAEHCDAAGWAMLADGVTLLAGALSRCLPTEPRHLALIGLLVDALYALRRAELRPDMNQAGHDLLRGLRLAADRELGGRAS
ncbi:hypothetical protein [Ferrovibrio xuzhouensis]|uniref:Flagellar protein FlaF n=1 Tax=Ferrovibrio xuzhouensis TaxID=1576914 RepID=A0ABV7VE31_9PROT